MTGADRWSDDELTVGSWWFAILFPPLGAAMAINLIMRRPALGVPPLLAALTIMIVGTLIVVVG